MATFGFSLSITGFSEMAQQLNVTGTALEAAKNATVDQVAQRLRDVAQGLADGGHPENPNVITGTLQNSIEWEHTADGEATTYTNASVEYSAPLEFGHEPSGWYANVPNAVPVPAYPFFENSITQVFDGGEAREIMVEVLSEAVQSQNGSGGTGASVNNPIPGDVAEDVEF